ncbi:glutamate carboxypeptidase 2-like [Actinia tenebrosa]|uniref:glutamate carboxypeptidase II n=1 Tax=Actinia tenebrosa TaxID=6105 RepID=A0A6P8HAW0_ACTTE|nr:glutamate carboxypeptidase 2-like [Actinia tenebrosa]
MKNIKGRYLFAIAIVVILLVGVSIAVGYVIGRAVYRRNELVEKTASTSSKVTSETEKQLLHKEAVEQVSSSNLRESLRYFTSIPHTPGSKETYDQALHIKNKWLEYGFDNVELKKYQVLLSFPEKAGVVAINAENGTELYKTLPPDVNNDPAYNDSRVFPPFSAYSPAGSVKGKLLFVNYARVSDFARLAKHNISCKDKILIARFGKTSRVFKHGRAHKAGAKGLIIYMDPQNYAKQGIDKVYPEYNWLPNNAVQRGTLKYSSVRGDPLTPGYPAVDGIYRLPLDEAKKGLPQIPVHPMPYKDAAPLLRMLTENGSITLKTWQGGLGFKYGVQMHPNDTREVTLNVSTVLQQKDIYNVIGTIRGTVEPDHLVLVGNHRDAWVYGAADPSSGTAAMMETSRVMSNLIKKGWKPRRSIVFCSWGAEEPQLMGSSEWLEDYAKLLYRRVVAYLNVDMSVDGNYSFRAKSMPLMAYALFDAAKKVPSPYGNETVFDEWRRKLPNYNKKLPILQSIRAGSDYAVFYQRLGIPCVDIRYTYDRETSGNPLYHTIYDNFKMMSTLIDPQFKYHQVTTRVWTQLAFNFADSIVVPLNVTNYASRLSYYTRVFEKKYKLKMAANGVTMEYVHSAITNFTIAAKKFKKVTEEVDKNDNLAVSRINERLIALEKAFIDQNTIIPEKPLQRHVILTPSINVYSSWYGGIAEAMYRADQKTSTWESVKEQISVVVYAIRSATHILNMSPI